VQSIAHVTATFPPYYAGTGTICFHNARLSAEAGYDVTVYTPRIGDEPEQVAAGVTIKRLPYQFRVGNAAFLGHLLALPRYDLVHLHYPFILSAELIWLKHRFANQPYVVSYHNDLIWDGMKGLLFRLYQAVWTRLILTGARRVIVTGADFVPSSFQLRQLRQSRADRLVEIPNGVDTQTFRPGLDATGVRRQHQIGERSRVILFVGAMDAAHDLKGGVPVLLRAIARLGDPGLVLLLVGGGDKVPAYTALAHALGIAGQTKFTGWVPQQQLGRYYAAADLVVVPSVRTEAFGMVVIEAAACARPVIASDLPGLRGVVRSTHGGVTVPAGDSEALATSIADLLSHPTRRVELGMLGRSAAERVYAWPVVARRLGAVYQEVLAESRPRHTWLAAGG
jgi:glycosyltransferase involved in cell wall biosynthesis